MLEGSLVRYTELIPQPHRVLCPQLCGFATVRGELGHFIPMETLAWEESQDQCLTWLLQLPSPESLTARTREQEQYHRLVGKQGQMQRGSG